jgi:hypothetical protein
MRHTDFIPRPDAAFENFFKIITSNVLDNSARWKHIPLDDAHELENQYDMWNNAYEKTLVPHIPQLTVEKNRVRTRTERYLRAFINRFLRWPPVTDLERDKMGIRNPDLVRTPSPVPTTVPEIETNTSVIRELSLRMRDFGAAAWGKPEHVRSMELAWGIREDRPGEVGGLPHLEAATANPIVLTFEEEERGRRVFFAARWLNNTAQAGPWSDIESAVVP